ncbi:hypothetical protein P7K49_027224, partial [Saguinus oedipus]
AGEARRAPRPGQFASCLLLREVPRTPPRPAEPLAPQRPGAATTPFLAQPWGRGWPRARASSRFSGRQRPLGHQPAAAWAPSALPLVAPGSAGLRPPLQ